MTSIPYYKMEEPKNSKCTPRSELKILSQETSVEMGYRRVQAGNRIHYLTINCDVYDESTMSRPYLLIPRLPEFPDTGWTAMHVSRGLYGSPVSTISYESLPSIESTWHPEYIDILSLHRTKRYTANFHQVLFNGCPAISKIACWEWEIPRLENETYVYKILSEHKDPNELPITPAILGHLTENGRVIGMLLEKVEGGFASLNDLAAYERILRRVHSMGITHGDVNRYNFLIDPSGGQVRLIDWEHAEVFDAKKATQELESLSNELTEETQRGAPLILEY